MSEISDAIERAAERVPRMQLRYLRVLVLLHMHREMGSGDARRALDIRHSAWMRITTSLQDLGYITSTVDKTDRRRVILALTVKGQRLMAFIQGADAMTNPIITWPYRLRAGHSPTPAQGACIMDAINWLMHGEHGDAPPCVAPPLRGYCIPGNDAMPDNVRQRFLPFAHRLAGSASPEHDAARVRVLVLGAVRVFASRALDAEGLTQEAARLRALPDDATYEEMRAAAARAAARAAAYAAYAAARAAADAAAYAADAAAYADGVWDDYFAVLDAALRAGPEGEPWSADAVERGGGSTSRRAGWPRCAA